MRIGGNPIPTERITSSPMQQTANQGVQTNDAVVTNENGTLTQADLQGAFDNAIATDDKIYIQTETGSAEFLAIDLSIPENRQMIESMLRDIQNGQPVTLDASMIEFFDVPNDFVDPNPEISLKDGENTRSELETMGINIRDGISEEEGQLIIEKLRSEGASAEELSTIQDQIGDGLGRRESFSLSLNQETGAYSFDFAERTNNRDFSWSRPKSILHHGHARTQGWNIPTFKGMAQIIATPFVAVGRGIGRLFGGPRVRCPSFAPRIDTFNLNPKIRMPQWSNHPRTSHEQGVTGPQQQQRTEQMSFNIQPQPPEVDYNFDFPNLYDNNRTAIEDKAAFRESTQEDNDVFADIVSDNPDLQIVIRADGSRNVDRSDWRETYSPEDLQSQRAIKGEYDSESNTFAVHGTASAAPGSGTYRQSDVPPFARDMIVPGETPVHNDTLSLFRSINAYIEFVRNADDATREAIEDKPVTFELNPEVRANLPPELVARLDAGLSWWDMAAVKF